MLTHLAKQAIESDSIDFICTNKESIDWHKLTRCCRLPLMRICHLEDLRDRVDWYHVSAYYNLRPREIREFKDLLIWESLSSNVRWTEELLDEFADRIDWCDLSAHQVLPEYLCEKYADRLDWDTMSTCFRFTTDFIRRFRPYLNLEFLHRARLCSDDLYYELVNKETIIEHHRI